MKGAEMAQADRELYQHLGRQDLAAQRAQDSVQLQWVRAMTMGAETTPRPGGPRPHCASVMKRASHQLEHGRGAGGG
ncbi:MAG: hypothetical protein ACYCW6_30505 [Candidatus Xenobia bacterium]